MHAVPLPLSLSDISHYLSYRRLMIDPEIIEKSVFALDDAFRSEWKNSQGKGEGKSY